MNQKLTLPQTIFITIVSIILITTTLFIPGMSILMVLALALIVVIGALSEKKEVIASISVVILSLVFMTHISNVLNISLNYIIPATIIGIITKKVLAYGNKDNKYEPIFLGSIVFMLGLVLNYIISKYLLDINLLESFKSIMKEQLSTQIGSIQESMSSLQTISATEINEDFIIKMFLNLMPMILFFRAIFLSIFIYFLGIFILKKIKKVNLDDVKFSKIYLPGNAILISFVLYIIIMLLKIVNFPLSMDLILFNLEMAFSILFLIQGMAVSIFFIKKWMKNGVLIKAMFGIAAIVLFGIPSISILGMIDCVFDFRKVRSF